MDGFGDPQGVWAAAAALQAASRTANEARGVASGATASGWTGIAADAYRGALKRSTAPADALSAKLSSASGILDRYAAVQQAAKTQYDQAVIDFDSNVAAVKADVLNVGAMLNVVAAKASALAAIGKLNVAAAAAAAELNGLSSTNEKTLGSIGDWWDPRTLVNPSSWSDPWGLFANESQTPGQPVRANVLTDDAFKESAIQQGSIGNCFMLASLVSILSTDEGDEFIRQNVRWDAEKEGYWVNVYGGGEKREVFVDKVYSYGARQPVDAFMGIERDKPSIAALYESALADTYGPGWLDGGTLREGSYAITGDLGKVVINDGYAPFDPQDMADFKSSLDSGGRVTVGTREDTPTGVEVKDASGKTITVDIVPRHAYSVQGVEPDGSMWVLNPWGPGNAADGGNKILLPPDLVGKAFDQGSIVPKK